MERLAVPIWISVEMKADMGMPLDDEEVAFLAEREARAAAYRRSWRYRLRRLLRRG